MQLLVSPIYIALSAVLLLVLSIRIIVLRKKYRVLFGDKDQPLLRKAIRAQANFTEYVPLALLLLVALELTVGSAIFLHLSGSCLLLGRMIHAWGLNQLHESLIWRQCGMLLTFSSLAFSSVLLLLTSVGLL